jgi:NitT/TauT family transport system permease protein
MTAVHQLGSTLGRPTLFILGLLLAWEAACVILNVPRFVVPRPSAILGMFATHLDTIVFHGRQTLMTTLIGFAVGTSIGFVLGVALGASARLYSIVFPTLVGINSIPKVAFVPLLVLWAGIGTTPAILTSAIIVIFPIAVIVSGAVATMDTELRDVLRSLGSSRLDVLKKVAIPQAMPQFFGSLKIAITLSFVGTILSESVAANRGLGYMMNRAASDFEVELVFSGLLSLSAAGILLYCVAVFVEKHFVGWAYRRE